MKILFVIHSFLPYSSTGVENYSYTLAKHLSKENKIKIFSAIFDPTKKRYQSYEYQYRGLDVISFYHDSIYKNFSETYNNEVLNNLFEKLIRDFRPDIVHFQHLLFHSTGYLNILKRENIPSILTLHDFYYLCPNLGQRLFFGRFKCKNKIPIKCAICFKTSKINISDIDKKLYNQASRIGILKKITEKFPEFTYPIKGLRLFKRYPTIEDIISREEAMHSFLGNIKVIISPSQYYKLLYERYTGHPKIVHLDYGFEIQKDSYHKDKKNGILTIGFIGTISRHKGAHLLLEVANRFKDSIRIIVWGNDKNDILLSKRVKSNKYIEYRGQFEPESRSKIFNEVDYLIVPSIWEENSPLVIHEALIHNTPVIASNIGGNPELIIEGKNGFLFDPFDIGDLFKLIEKIINSDIKIKNVDKSTVMDISTHIKKLKELYQLK